MSTLLLCIINYTHLPVNPWNLFLCSEMSFWLMFSSYSCLFSLKHNTLGFSIVLFEILLSKLNSFNITDLCFSFIFLFCLSIQALTFDLKVRNKKDSLNSVKACLHSILYRKTPFHLWTKHLLWLWLSPDLN